MSVLAVSHPTGIIEGAFLLPTSKSIANRLLVLQALFPNRLTITNLSNANDTMLLESSLKQLSGVVNVKNAGTCFRFLTAFYASRECDVVLHGNERLHQRPIAPLVDALRSLGADIDYIDREGYAPLRIRGKVLTGNEVKIDATESSQYVSALMLIAPSLPDGLTIKLNDNPVSATYITMTERLLFDAGIFCTLSDNGIDIPPQIPSRKTIAVEQDWSSASYWYAMATLSKNCDILLPGLTNSYLQGDVALAGYMERFGVTTSFSDEGARLTKSTPMLAIADYNLSGEPDLMPAMAVALAGLGVRVRFGGIGHLKHKESDRIATVSAELMRCGYRVGAEPDALFIENETPNFNRVPEILTYGDHRIAMAFSMMALRFGEIHIQDHQVVEKSYPGFWDELKKAGFILRPV